MNIPTAIFYTIIISKSIEKTLFGRYDTSVQPPPKPVSILMTSLNEEDFILPTLTSISKQSIILNYPEYFEFILVDSNSTDSTLKIARNHLSQQPYASTLITAPRGKLTAKNIGISHTSNDIIVSIDADCYYPEHWLNTLLKPLHNPHVLAVNGSTIESTKGFVNMFNNIFEVGSSIIHPNKLLGRNSAFTKEVYYMAGRYNESVNQLDVTTMVLEEEINFGNRVAAFGKVVHKLNASCIHLGGLKIQCRLFSSDPQCITKNYVPGKTRF